jgi:hypothetical protein
MDGYHDPIDFSGIVGYPHDISEDVIDNVPDYKRPYRVCCMPF